MKNQKEQEKTMNTKIFEYCIINFDNDGIPNVVVGPEVIAILGEEYPRDTALLKIGQKHFDIINENFEVQIRPFC